MEVKLGIVQGGQQHHKEEGVLVGPQHVPHDLAKRPRGGGVGNRVVGRGAFFLDGRRGLNQFLQDFLHLLEQSVRVAFLGGDWLALGFVQGPRLRPQEDAHEAQDGSREEGDAPAPVEYLFVGQHVAHQDRDQGAEEVAHASKDGDETAKESAVVGRGVVGCVQQSRHQFASHGKTLQQTTGGEHERRGNAHFLVGGEHARHDGRNHHERDAPACMSAWVNE